MSSQFCNITKPEKGVQSSEVLQNQKKTASKDFISVFLRNAAWDCG